MCPSAGLLNWTTQVEALRFGDVEMTEHDVTTTQVIKDDAMHIQVSPLCCLSVAHTELLIVTKVFTRDNRLLFRAAFTVDADTHNFGPYDVFADQALILMKTESLVGVGESHYTKQFPREWTGCTLIFPLSLLPTTAPAATPAS